MCEFLLELKVGSDGWCGEEVGGPGRTECVLDQRGRDRVVGESVAVGVTVVSSPSAMPGLGWFGRLGNSWIGSNEASRRGAHSAGNAQESTRSDIHKLETWRR